MISAVMSYYKKKNLPCSTVWQANAPQAQFIKPSFNLT